jgi:hypothetical protein
LQVILIDLCVTSCQSMVSVGSSPVIPLDRVDRLYVSHRIDSYRSDRLLREAEFGPTASDVGYPIGPPSEMGNLAASPKKFWTKAGLNRTVEAEIVLTTDPVSLLFHSGFCFTIHFTFLLLSLYRHWRSLSYIARKKHRNTPQSY